jgi:hypothetical protein
MNKGSLYSFSDGIEIAAGDKTWDVFLDDNPLRDRTAKFPIYSIWRIVAGGIFLGHRWMRITGIFKPKLIGSRFRVQRLQPIDT